MIKHKYYNDFNFSEFINQYYKIPTIKDNKFTEINFELNKQQKELLNKFLENDYVVCKKSRQVGGSTLIAAILLIQALLSEGGEHFYYVGINKMMCDDMASKVKRFINRLPLVIFNDCTKPILKKDNRKEIVFNNNTTIHYVTIDDLDKSMIGIGNIRTVILDEVSCVNVEMLLKQLYYLNNMSLRENFKILVISTPKKTEDNSLNVFKELYSFAKVKHSLYWWNDSRFNKGIVWVKNDDILYRTNFDNFNELYENGWKPISPWYCRMYEAFGHDLDKIKSELDCEFE